ncbi:hypothetical protein Q8F55_009018 [Vanrija albida]|uniref:CFEM domain-containing protein n=1 Tax=Vanrija albida TaxID=181172 RepID=A0ABR3PSG7_9TREE
MPPAPSPPPPHLAVEAAPAPSMSAKAPWCVGSCFAHANTTGCPGFSSLRCLCESDTFLSSVQGCWLAVCTGDAYAFAQAYAEAQCAGVAGTRLVTHTVAGQPAVATNSYLPPVVLSRAVWNIQAIMSSICSVLLLAALALGFLSCRNQARRAAQQAATSAWSGIGSALGGSRHATVGSMSRPAAAHFSHSRARSRGADESFVGMESFFLPSRVSGPLPAPVAAKKKFTNRITEEEWEMGDVGEGPSSEGGHRARQLTWDDGSDDSEAEPPLSASSRFTNRLSARTQAAADRLSLSTAPSDASHEVFIATRVHLSSPRPGHSPPPSAASTGFEAQQQLTLWDNDSALESDFAAGNAFLAERGAGRDKGKGRATWD